MTTEFETTTREMTVKPLSMALTVPAVSGKGGIAGYLEAIQKFPILTQEEERDLSVRYQTSGDLSAARELVATHLRLAAKIAFSYRHYGFPVSDLISEANIGLMTAVKKFDPEKGYRLSTYAMWWIKANINEFVLRSWSLVKIGTMAAQKRLFYGLRKLKAKLGIYDDRGLSEENAQTIAREMNVSEKDVYEMDGRISGDSSLNDLVKDGNGTERQDFLADAAPSQETVYAEAEEQELHKSWIKAALSDLSAREQAIIVRRRLKEDPDTLESIAADLSISRERVRQIEASAFKKISEFIKNKAGAAGKIFDAEQ